MEEVKPEVVNVSSFGAIRTVFRTAFTSLQCFFKLVSLSFSREVEDGRRSLVRCGDLRRIDFTSLRV